MAGFFSSLFGSSNSNRRAHHQQGYASNKGPTTTAAPSSRPTQPSRRDIRDTVVICYEQRYHDVSFRDFPNGMRQATVADLKERCKRLTGVTLATMKLKVSGAYIKDDNATLVGSGIHENSVVQVLGVTANQEQINQTASKNPEEVGYISRICKVMESLEKAETRLTEFENAIQSTSTQPQEQRLKTHDLGIHLSENLMQALISLDAVDCPPEFETARLKRKEAVRKCQMLMDRVDNSRAALKKYLILEDTQQRL